MHEPDLGPLSHEADGPENNEVSLGPLLWSLTGFGFLVLLGIMVLRSLPADLDPRVDPPVRDQAAVPGWEVELAGAPSEQGAEGAELRTVRLEALHASPQRQAFDAAALAKIIGQEGEPWLLLLPQDFSPESLSIRSGVGVLESVREGSHPVLRILHATVTTQRRVLFGKAPEAPILEVDGVLHPMSFIERPASMQELPLVGGGQ